MRLIIREYLASLRERNELDALLPDLLSQMGLEVFSKPSVGGRQYGVDVAAFGSVDGEEKVYLFTVKAGDLTRRVWNSGSEQDVLPSLNDIINTYITTHLPKEYKNKPIEIAVCFGGDLKENVRQDFTSYQDRNNTENLKIIEWGGEKLSSHIEDYLLSEELILDESRTYLRKALAMIEEPDVSVRYFRELAVSFFSREDGNSKKTLTNNRQVYLCLWVLFSWCRKLDNLESACVSAEIVLLYMWDSAKDSMGKKDKTSQAILSLLISTKLLHMQILDEYLENKIMPHIDKHYALSTAVQGSCSVDVNLKMFDLLGRIGLFGSYLTWISFAIETEEKQKENREKIAKYRLGILKLAGSNPALLSPLKDDQAIDISIAFIFLMYDMSTHGDLSVWLERMIDQIGTNFMFKKGYPTIIRDYKSLVEHPKDDTDKYFESVTNGSILIPYLALFSSILELDKQYTNVKAITDNFLSHSTLQFWFPDDASEKHFYKFDDVHGGALTHVSICADREEFLRNTFSECEKSNEFRNLSAIVHNSHPVILTACKHYRLPVPIHFFSDLYNALCKVKQKNESEPK